MFGLSYAHCLIFVVGLIFGKKRRRRRRKAKDIARGVLRYKFSDLNFISPLTKIPTQAHKLFWAHINILHIYHPNILHVIGLSQIFHAQAYKLPWALSQILPIIAHILSNLGFHKNIHHIATLLSHKIIPSL